MILLFADSKVRFRFIDIVYPVHSPVQPFYNSLGAIALPLLIFVVVTSYFRPRLGNRRWKKLHFTTYALAVVFYSHAILTNPDLKDVPLDPLDGEKIFVEGCALLVIAAIVWRVRTGPTSRCGQAHPGSLYLRTLTTCVPILSFPPHVRWSATALQRTSHSLLGIPRPASSGGLTSRPAGG